MPLVYPKLAIADQLTMSIMPTLTLAAHHGAAENDPAATEHVPNDRGEPRTPAQYTHCHRRGVIITIATEQPCTIYSPCAVV